MAAPPKDLSRWAPFGGNLPRPTSPTPTKPREQKDTQAMKWNIGDTFTTAAGAKRWRVTDVGTRVITAIPLKHGDESDWYIGPPYAVAESVFDEEDQMGIDEET